MTGGWAPLWRAIIGSDDWRGTSPVTKLVMIAVILRLRHTGDLAGTCDVRLTDLAGDVEASSRAVRSSLDVLAAPPRSWLMVDRKQTGVRITVPSWRRWVLRSELRSDQIGSRRQLALGVASPGSAVDGTSDRNSVPIPHYKKKEQDPDLIPGADYDRSAPTGGGDGVGVPPTRLITDAFQAEYERSYGRKPTWNAKVGRQVKSLLSAHGVDRVLEAIDVLFNAPPSWLSGPYDFGTLVSQFDKLVPPGQSGQPQRMSARDIIRRAEAMDRRRA